MTDVYLDDKFVGTVENTTQFLNSIKEERRKNKLPTALNVFYNESSNEIFVEISKGRARRPLIIVENGQSKLTETHLSGLKAGKLKWSDLLKESVIEYLDAAEEENTLVAFKPEDLTKEHTH